MVDTMQQYYLGFGILPEMEFTGQQKTMGITMKSFWLNMFYDASFGSVNGLTWDPITTTDWNVMVFKGNLGTHGAAMNPCIDATACLVEDTGAYREANFYKWQDYLGTIGTLPGPPVTAATCSKGATGPTMRGVGYWESCSYYDDMKCADWCNFYTCGMDACTDCAWQKPEMCGYSDAFVCADWCNIYTCDADLCSGCSICEALEDGTHCSSWCNSYLCPFYEDPSSALYLTFFADHCTG